MAIKQRGAKTPPCYLICMVVKTILRTKIVIDNIKILHYLEEIPETVDFQREEPFSLNGITFRPQNNNGFIGWYKGQLRNLDLRIHGDKIFIRNSIHKYWKGNNYSDFTFSELQRAFIDLENRLNLPIIEKGIIKSLEVGCNLEFNAYKEYSIWNLYKGDEPKEMFNYSGGKEYGKQIWKTDYKIKLYDKSKETSKHYGIDLNKELARFEVSISNLRHYHNRNDKIYLYTVKNLLERNIIEQLINDSMNKLDSIQRTSIDLSTLTLEERKIYSSMISKEVRESIKKDFQRAYKDHSRRFKSFTKASQSKEFKNALEAKFQDLLNN